MRRAFCRLILTGCFLILAAPARACGICMYEMMSYSFPPTVYWMFLVPLWYVAQAGVFLARNEKTRWYANFSVAVLVVGGLVLFGLIGAGPMPLALVLLCMLVQYGALFVKSEFGVVTLRISKALGAVMIALLLLTAAVSYMQAARLTRVDYYLKYRSLMHRSILHQISLDGKAALPELTEILRRGDEMQVSIAGSVYARISDDPMPELLAAYRRLYRTTRLDSYNPLECTLQSLSKLRPPTNSSPDVWEKMWTDSKTSNSAERKL